MFSCVLQFTHLLKYGNGGKGKGKEAKHFDQALGPVEAKKLHDLCMKNGRKWS